MLVTGVSVVTLVVGRVEEQRETIGYVNRNSDSDSDSECYACGGAMSGVGGVEDYYFYMYFSGSSRPEICFKHPCYIYQRVLREVILWPLYCMEGNAVTTHCHCRRNCPSFRLKIS